ncbi:MAG: hypothetical protein ACK55I_36610, partial [bacterium]
WINGHIMRIPALMLAYIGIVDQRPGVAAVGGFVQTHLFKHIADAGINDPGLRGRHPEFGAARV